MSRHHRHRRRLSAPAILAFWLALWCSMRRSCSGSTPSAAASSAATRRSRSVRWTGGSTRRRLQLTAQGRTWDYRSGELTNLLFIGVDWDDERLASADTRYEGQADFLLLLSLDGERKVVSSVQIDRDTLADIRVYGAFGDYAGTRRTQICLAYAFGATPEEGCENTVWGGQPPAGRHPHRRLSGDGHGRHRGAQRCAGRRDG